MEIPNESFSYVSAATSPISVSSMEDSMNFYSAPTSPASDVCHSLFGSLTEPTTPTRSYHQDLLTNRHSSFDDHRHDFEFETSLRFNRSTDVESGQESENSTGKVRDRGVSLTTMAFADELFCDGKVVPLAAPQLKLPPGFCHRNDRFGCPSGLTSDPKSPRSVVRLPFSRPCLWNDDFDPFMVALENVKEEERGGRKMDGKNGRRARSLSPLRSRPNEQSMGLLVPHRLSASTETSARWAGPLEERKDVKGPIEDLGFESNGLPLGKQEGKCTKDLAEPKGVVFARRVRLVKMDQENPSGPSLTSVQWPTSESGGSGSSRRENKRPKLMRLLFRIGFRRKESDDEKVQENGAALGKPTFFRRLSLRSRGKNYSREKTVVSQVAKMTIIQYRPRFTLCMGNGAAKYVQ